MAENLGPSRIYLFEFSPQHSNLSHRFFSDDRGAPPFPPAFDILEVFLGLGNRATSVSSLEFYSLPMEPFTP
jgi:hypothetical protein